MLSAALGFIAVSISSKNSFLYTFNDSSDIQTFVTTARCMLRGDVLYRDVFDVKGPLLYFFYMLGLLMDGSTFHGIFVLESILFIAFTVLCYFIADLYLESPVLKIAVAGVSAFVSTTGECFFGGGQCEELLLPVLACVIYVVLKYFRREYPERIKWYDVMAIGLCAGIIIWVKYTIVGIVIGIVLYVIIVQVQDKKIGNIWVYAGQFLIGLLIGSLPTIVYFGLHGAFDALLEVYFYDLIFVYRDQGGQFAYFLTENFFRYYIGVSAMTAFALVYPLLDGGRHLGKRERSVIGIMVLAMGLGISGGMHWTYALESMQVFAPIGVVFMIYTILDCKAKMKLLIVRFMQVIETVMAQEFFRKKYYLALPVAILLLLNVEIFVTPLVVIAGAIVFARMMRQLLTPLILKHKQVLWIKYLILFGIYYLVTVRMTTSVNGLFADVDVALVFKMFVRLFLLFSLVTDYPLFRDYYRESFLKQLGQWKNEYHASTGKIHYLAGFFGLILYIFYCYALSKSSYDIGTPLEEKPPFQMVEYIRNSGVEDPVVVYYKDIDYGYYWLSQTYPETKYSCDFNIALPEIEEVYKEYVEEGKADFVLTTNSEDDFLPAEYVKVYVGSGFYVNETTYKNYVLWQRKDTL